MRGIRAVSLGRKASDPGSLRGVPGPSLRFAVGVFFLLLLTTAGLVAALSAPGLPGNGISPQATGPVVGLTVNGAVATETPYFWGTFIDGPTVPSSEIALLNATPIKSLRAGANQIDQENWSNGCMYVGGVTGGVCTSIQESPVAFAHLCQALPSDHCLLGLPGETANVSTDVYLMNWLYAQTGWKPTCWAMGNEPEDWTHYGIPWTSWLATDNSRVTATQFAALSAQMATAVRQDQPGACIIGGELNSNQMTGGTWTQAIARDDPNASGIAFHAYPDGQCTGLGVSQLLGRSNLTNLSSRLVNEIRPAAHGISLSLDEFNMGLAPCQGLLPLGQTYLGQGVDATFTAADVAQALSDGLPQFDFFRFWCSSGYDCMVNGTYETAVYHLYAGLFNHMDIATVHNVTLSGANAETWAVLGAQNLTANSLLLVNAAATGRENVSLAGIDPANWSGTVYFDSAALGVQTLSYTPGETLTLPAESEAVVQLHAPTASTPVVRYGLSGTIRVASGTGLSGATVFANGTTSAPPVVTPASGSYSLSLPNGTYMLTATAPGYASGSRAVVISGTAVTGIDLGLVSVSDPAHPAYMVTGSVLSSRGHGPVAGATVSFSNGTLTAWAVSNGFGGFTTRLPNGTYAVSVTAPGYQTGSTTVRVAGDAPGTLQIRLKPLSSNPPPSGPLPALTSPTGLTVVFGGSVSGTAAAVGLRGWRARATRHG